MFQLNYNLFLPTAVKSMTFMQHSLLYATFKSTQSLLQIYNFEEFYMKIIYLYKTWQGR